MPPGTRCRTRLLVLLLPVAVTAACTALEIGDGDPPHNRRPKKDVVHCYDRFDNVKQKMHEAGTPKKADWQWHHIVGQNNIDTFGAHDLHCDDNLVYLPRAVHEAINGHYNSKLPSTDGKTVRAWLATRSFDDQYAYGVRILAEHGYRP